MDKSDSDGFFYPHNKSWWSFNGFFAIGLVTIKVGIVLLMLASWLSPKAKHLWESIRPAPTGLNQWGE